MSPYIMPLGFMRDMKRKLQSSFHLTSNQTRVIFDYNKASMKELKIVKLMNSLVNV